MSTSLDLFDRWEQDADFRAALARDPAAALAAAGIELEPAERAALLRLAHSASDQELKARLNAKNC